MEGVQGREGEGKWMGKKRGSGRGRGRGKRGGGGERWVGLF